MSTSTSTSAELARRLKINQESLFKDYLSGKVKGDPSLKISSGPIFWEGWIKYFHYNNGGKVDRPKHFFINEQYYHQRALKTEMKKKDEVGFTKIPTKFHFFARLLPNNLNVLFSREHDLMRNVETLNLDIIKPVPENNRLKGGIQDLGDFDEGKCFQVSTTVPVIFKETFYSGSDGGFTEHWILCTDDASSKAKLLGTMVKLRIIKQKSLGITERTDKPASIYKKRTISSELANLNNSPKIEKAPGWKLVDGYWILLSDWSECTLKCGGGYRYQQWMCIPPKKGGKGCAGQSIRTKPCNRIACPNVGGLNTLQRLGRGNEVAKPIYKLAPFTARPQRYVRCSVKEQDVLYKSYDTQLREIKMPSRIVMNNRTITLYNDERYHKHVFTFNLPQVSIYSSVKDPCCFILRSLNQQFEICGFQTECGSKANPVFYKSWEHDFVLWQTQCFKPLNDKEWDSKTKRIWDTKLEKVNIDLIGEKTKLIKEKLDLYTNNKMEKKIKNTHKTAMRALRKEAAMEMLVEKEEKERFEKEQINLVKIIKKEKKKRDCLDKALKERELEDERNRKSKEAENTINMIKLDAAKQVVKKRDNLKKRIALIKKKAGRRRRILEQQLQKVRGQMAKSLIGANRYGDWKICSAARTVKNKVVKYCDANFIDDFVKNRQCKDQEDFCYICCENEYGNMYIKSRDKCYDMCDAMSKKDLSNGEWQWIQHETRTVAKKNKK
jgi:hypothetical protein